METELNAIVLTLKELAEWQTELMARLEEVQSRLNELQVGVNADESQSN